MTISNEEFQFTIAQFLLIDPTAQTPRVHPKRMDMSKGQLLKRIDTLIREVEEQEIEFDLTPYKETAKQLRKMKKREEYEEVMSEILLAYTPQRKARKPKQFLPEKNTINPIVPVKNLAKSSEDLSAKKEKMQVKQEETSSHFFQKLKRNFFGNAQEK
ncbi:hypothetical protein SAMN02745116_00379 [Pilibacter termitis]|uniref:Uncharacterized protein n=1 Tax=Pilibacter termitis TaxID=263852 RepID=A0A1T4KTC1_9ENTE|nr:hypothetical protein [Pilibacter termitis]SJZ45694.1 hypothetical protein SAMN02745116_00379 [Pilibacter termitis]